VDVVGSSPLAVSYRGCFVFLAAGHGRAGRGFEPRPALVERLNSPVASYRSVLRGQPPRVLFLPISFDTSGAVHEAADELLKRLQGLVRHAALAHEFSRVERPNKYKIVPSKVSFGSPPIGGWGLQLLRR
jgi:hypothetical protein